MKALILSDGIPGHFNQSIGIASLISEEIPIKYEIVESKLTFNIFRSLFMQYQKFLAKKFNDKNARKIINMHQKICVDDIDLIISCGKKVAYHSAAISKVASIINIHAGSVTNIDLKNFSVHITGEAVENSPNNVSSVIAPTKYKPVIRKSKKTNKVLFLIGGDGAGYKFTDKDWINLVENIKKNKMIPIVITSRRTNKSHENLLINELKNISDENSVWYHKSNIKIDLNRLYLDVDCIYVTEESATMATEAISSGLPVYTLYPELANPSQFFVTHLLKYEKLNFIKRQSMQVEFDKIIYDSFSVNKVLEIRNNLRIEILKKINL
jgi:mitochondrial fission protein ELM1